MFITFLKKNILRFIIIIIFVYLLFKTFYRWLNLLYYSHKNENIKLILIIFGLYRGSSRVEEAVECYQRAANMFKMAKKWSAAGSAFYEAADLHAKAGSRHDAANCYVDASNCFKKSDVNGIIILFI